MPNEINPRKQRIFAGFRFMGAISVSPRSQFSDGKRGKAVTNLTIGPISRTPYAGGQPIIDRKFKGSSP